MKPEEKVRQKIDLHLQSAGWEVQDRAALNLYAGQSDVHSVVVRKERPGVFGKAVG
jgi:type I site-specific restriction endonuclease